MAAHANRRRRDAYHPGVDGERAPAIYVISDLHGAVGALSAAVPKEAVLVLLGDLVNLLDYRGGTGILYDVFSRDAVERVSGLRARGRFDEAREVIRQRTGLHGPGAREEIGRRVTDQLVEVFAALPERTLLILGNVDPPEPIRALADDSVGVELVDGRVVDLGGETFGFVGGALPTPLSAPGEISAEEIAAKLEALGPVDVICTHIPPAVPELCYDTLARRSESGSNALLRYIQNSRPRRAYFGHVHQPLVSSMYVGQTLCMNVGYFRATGRPWIHSREMVVEEAQ